MTAWELAHPVAAKGVQFMAITLRKRHHHADAKAPMDKVPPRWHAARVIIPGGKLESVVRWTCTRQRDIYEGTSYTRARLYERRTRTGCPTPRATAIRCVHLQMPNRGPSRPHRRVILPCGGCTDLKSWRGTHAYSPLGLKPWNGTRSETSILGAVFGRREADVCYAVPQCRCALAASHTSSKAEKKQAYTLDDDLLSSHPTPTRPAQDPLRERLIEFAHGDHGRPHARGRDAQVDPGAPRFCRAVYA